MKSFENAHIEIQQAQIARDGGNEGRARVLARRAAGLAVRDYLLLKYQISLPGSLFDHLAGQRSRDLLPPQLAESLNRLCLKVNEQFQLPAGVDLIADANAVVSLLEANLEE